MRDGFDYSSIMLPEGWKLVAQTIPADDSGDAPYLAINPSGAVYHLSTSDGYNVCAFCRDETARPSCVCLPIDPSSAEAAAVDIG